MICDTICGYKKNKESHWDFSTIRRFHAVFILYNLYTYAFSIGIRTPRGLLAHTLTLISAERAPATIKDNTEIIIVSFFKINTVLLITYSIIICVEMHYIIGIISEIF